MHRKRQCGSVETIIDEAFGNVGFGNARCSLEIAAFENQLVPYPTLSAFVERSITIVEQYGKVIGVENGVTGGIGKAFGTHHANVAVSDG